MWSEKRVEITLATVFIAEEYVKRKTQKPDTPPPIYPISVLSPASHRRWMLFVDGENFTFRAQEFARQQNLTLKSGRHLTLSFGFQIGADDTRWFRQWRLSVLSQLQPLPIITPVSSETNTALDR
jgi:hypothetical protein